MRTRKLYESRTDAIEHEIRQPLGEHVDDFDVAAIADAVIEHQGSGTQLRFYCGVDAPEFWAVVERYDRHRSTGTT